MRGRLTRWGCTALVAVAVMALAGCWRPTGQESIAGLTQAQGLATVRPPGGTPYLYYTGEFSPPQALKDQGWSHVGDPDSRQGYIFDAYQWGGSGSAMSKMFNVTTPSGAQYEYVHQLAPGEAMNNSFAAVTPDGSWLVSGEWGTMNRLLVFPTPILNPGTAQQGGALSMAGVIHTDVPITDIQGCTFVTDLQMICSSDDPVAENGLDRKSLIQLDLQQPVSAGDGSAHVTPLFPVPEELGTQADGTTCPQTGIGSWPDDFEVEGVDYDPVTRQLRVEMVPPGVCALTSRVYVYTATPSAPASSRSSWSSQASAG